jgi:hypothetical protein
MAVRRDPERRRPLWPVRGKTQEVMPDRAKVVASPGSSSTWRTKRWQSVFHLAARTAASGSKMSCRSPRNVIVLNREQSPFAAHYESLPIGAGYREVPPN